MVSLLADAVGAVPVDFWFMCTKVEKLLCPNREKYDLEINTTFDMIFFLLWLVWVGFFSTS